MNTITLKRAVNGPKLDSELRLLFPAFDAATAWLEWTDTDVWVHVPDGVDTAAVMKALVAHDIAPLPPEPDPNDVLIAELTAATTMPQLKAALLIWVNARRGRAIA